MNIGVPKETKQLEARVALTPNDCNALIQKGHKVYVQKGAGEGAGYTDKDYHHQGVLMPETAADLYATAQLIVKVKEPLESDLANLKPHHHLFCYLHLAGNPGLAEKLEEIGLNATAFETVVEGSETPLLAPMSAVAGRLAIQLGAAQLHATKGGRGVMLGGISGFKAGKVTIIGAGVAGTQAAQLALAMGAEVTILDIDGTKLQRLQHNHPQIHSLYPKEGLLEEILPETDLLIGAVYVLGKKAPQVVKNHQIQLMPKGSVAVDISIDQGGCLESSEARTYDQGVYEKFGIHHITFANMPAAAPRTASQALSAAILPYVEELANGQPRAALKKGINIKEGRCVIDL